MDGHKDILGCWIFENEGAASSICSELKKRGVSDVFAACHDNLKGLSEAVSAIFPKTKNQLCILYQIRNSTKFVTWKDRKAVCADLKKVYGAANLDDAEYALEELMRRSDSGEDRKNGIISILPYYNHGTPTGQSLRLSLRTHKKYVILFIPPML